jgi:transposase
MAWASTLAADLAARTLPLVLAGPILRRVTPNSVAVWVALRESRNVTLIVTDTYGADSGSTAQVQTTANRDTVQIGTYLHLVTVIARLPDNKPLTPGPIYFYDMVFDDRQGSTLHLGKAVGTNALGNPVAYPPYDLPSFALPPSDLNALRLIHGSCRKPHGSGPDALWMLDGLITQGARDGNLRPHQLLLTGDQIYADDVADVLLMALSDAGETLLGWKEAFPVPAFGSSTQTSSVADWPPEFRQCPLLVAGFTSDDLRSHLMSLGEYLAMYLFAWSDVLWPKTMPTYDDLKAAAQPILPQLKGVTIVTPTFDDYLGGPVSIGLPAYLKTLGTRFSALSYTIRLRYLTFTAKMSPVPQLYSYFFDLAIHAVVDNYATHKHPKVQKWLARHPRWTFHFTPTSASWLNAVEGFFAKLTRRRLKRGVFRSVADLQAAINRFVEETNSDPKPFVWTADAKRVLAAVKRGKEKLESIH